MAAIRGIGSYIENSGLDDVFVESGIYGPCTLRQILDCTHYKRSISAHSSLFLALYELMFESYLNLNPHIRGPCVDIVKQFEKAISSGNEDKDSIDKHRNILDFISTSMSSSKNEFLLKGFEDPKFKAAFNCICTLLMSF